MSTETEIRHRPSPMPRGLRAAVERVEDDPRLDAVARGLDTAARPIAASPRAEAALRGHWLGHSLHPLLTDVPLGMWMSAVTLDLAGGAASRRAATLLVGAGLAAAVPTAASGVADWLHTGGRARRTGAAHGVLNGSATLLFAGSLAARVRRRHRAGVALGLAGAALASAGGYLGGHLTLVAREGYADPVLDARTR